MPALVEVTSFIDWNTQRIQARRRNSDKTVSEETRLTLDYIGAEVGKVLSEISKETRFIVRLRLYHGWHKGFEVTDRRKALKNAIPRLDFVAMSCKQNVIFRDAVEFGDKLISCDAKRYNASLDCHLPNTLRKSLDDPQREEEKMVDTAMAVDIVDMAHRAPHEWLLVFAKDDDMVPPVFAAESIIGDRGGCVKLVRRRPLLSRYMNFEGLGILQ